LPEDHPLQQQHCLLLRAAAQITWTFAFSRHLAVSNGLRILLARGYDSFQQIQDDDLKLLSSYFSKGADALDAALCSLGVFSRTPKRGSARHSRRRRLAASELVEVARIPGQEPAKKCVGLHIPGWSNYVRSFPTSALGQLSQILPLPPLPPHDSSKSSYPSREWLRKSA
jgi:hypothetical protein